MVHGPSPEGCVSSSCSQPTGHLCSASSAHVSSPPGVNVFSQVHWPAGGARRLRRRRGRRQRIPAAAVRTQRSVFVLLLCQSGVVARGVGGCGNPALLLLLHRFFVIFLSLCYVIHTRAYATCRHGVIRGAGTTATSTATATSTGLPRPGDKERRAPDPLGSLSRRPFPHETQPTELLNHTQRSMVASRVRWLRRCDHDRDRDRDRDRPALRRADRPATAVVWRRREMQRSWRGSAGCGVTAVVGGGVL